MTYRFDGQGYLKDGHHHLFVLPAEGGTPRQLTKGPFDHGQSFFGAWGIPSWAPGGKAIVISGNRHEDAEHAVVNTEVYEVTGRFWTKSRILGFGSQPSSKRLLKVPPGRWRKLGKTRRNGARS
jgi:hypothetical protein